MVRYNKTKKKKKFLSNPEMVFSYSFSRDDDDDDDVVLGIN
jgi:hypothetical protein